MICVGATPFQEVELNSDGLECRLNLVTYFQRTEFGEGKARP